jgi:uncharacterized membrane protein
MKNITKFKFKLDFTSLVKLSALIGFCFGVVSAPIVVMLNMSEIGISIIPIAFIATPLVSLLNGALFGFLGYPLYSWIHNKVGINYKGSVEIVEQ